MLSKQRSKLSLMIYQKAFLYLEKDAIYFKPCLTCVSQESVCECDRVDERQRDLKISFQDSTQPTSGTGFKEKQVL
jgi:hypothetical protein